MARRRRVVNYKSGAVYRFSTSIIYIVEYNALEYKTYTNYCDFNRMIEGNVETKFKVKWTKKGIIRKNKKEQDEKEVKRRRNEKNEEDKKEEEEGIRRNVLITCCNIQPLSPLQECWRTVISDLLRILERHYCI